MEASQVQPQPRRKPRFFYGWVVLIVGGVCNAMSWGAGGASFSVFLRPMSESLGWNRTTLTGAVTTQSILNLIVTPIVGPFLDKYGGRVIIAAGATIAGTAYVLMGQISQPWHFYILYTIAFALGLHELGASVTTTIVSKWFVRMRGRAVALSFIGNNVGGTIIPFITAFVIGQFGWRTAWMVLGLLIASVVVPSSLLFMRRTPEDMGLAPDGDSPEETSGVATHAPRRPEPRWGPKAALRTKTLWLVILGSNLGSLYYSTILLHQVAFFTDIGLTLQAASLALGLQQATSIPSKLFWGLLAERIPVRFCMLGNYISGAVALLVLLLGEAPERVYLFALLSGFGSSIGSLQSQIWADYYGRAFLGTIRGLTTPFQLFSSVGGPLFAAFVFDTLGSYNRAFWIYVGTLCVAVVVMFIAKPPIPHASQLEPEPTQAAT